MKILGKSTFFTDKPIVLSNNPVFKILTLEDDGSLVDYKSYFDTIAEDKETASSDQYEGLKF